MLIYSKKKLNKTTTTTKKETTSLNHTNCLFTRNQEKFCF